jgi:hypothetical protein
MATALRRHDAPELLLFTQRRKLRELRAAARINLERCPMKELFKDMSKLVRWGIVEVILAIIALPVLTSLVSTI